MTVEVREATPGDRLGVRRVLDAAMLEVRDDLGKRIEAGDVLVACEAGIDDDHPILGALVLVPRSRTAHVHAVAVRRARRGRGIGSELVRAAAERHPRLTAEFDPNVRDFYESLGFEIEAVDDGRLRGRYGFESDG
jgi:GNAT superfamily N-acetyltransferase